MSLILDSSLAVAFVIHAERSEPVESVIRRVGSQGATTVSLWYWEVANALQMAVRRGRIAPHDRDEGFRILRRLPIETDRQGEARAWSTTVRLAEEHGLTIYDAAYLELALRRRLPLASADRQLVAAAARTGVTIL